ncbi:MAG: MFS transporter [Hyphomicrobiaceae bacterium]
MTAGANSLPRSGVVSLPFLVLARLCTSAIFMTYPACLSVLLLAWEMSATQAGIVQSAFTAGFAISLLVASFLCDRVGAKRVFNASTFLSAVTALLFAAFARSYESALVFVALVGLTQGGTYTPAIMLVSANTVQARKAAAVGWVLAGMSAGYVISIFLSQTMIALAGYQAAFWLTASITVLGWVFGYLAVSNAEDSLPTVTGNPEHFGGTMKHRSRLLLLGYIGHSWELLGAWAWVPAFLAAALLSSGAMSPIELGLWTALALHLSGFFASVLSGYAADRFGAPNVLVAFAMVGALCSAAIGWMGDVSAPLLLLVAAVYGFVIIGDSSVLSSAMTDAVPAQYLGRVLGLRSVLGIGAGAVSPAVFGIAFDAAPVGATWGYGFSTLAVGGVLAFVCAALLRRAYR